MILNKYLNTISLLILTGLIIRLQLLIINYLQDK